MRILCCLFLSIFVFSQCVYQNKSLNSIDFSSLHSDSLVYIEKWVFLGPFDLDTSLIFSARHHSDVLQNYSTSENELVNEFYKAALYLKDKDSTIKFGRLNLPRHEFDIQSFVKSENPSTVYLMTSIESSERKEVALAFNAFQSCKLWINGKFIYDNDWKRGLTKYRDDLVNISLNKGNNTLVAKVSATDFDYSSLRWRFKLDITSKESAEKYFVASYRNSFIQKTLLQSNENLKIYLGPFANIPIKVKIMDMQNNILHEESKTPALKTGVLEMNPKLIDGLYRCKLFLPNDTLDQHFFYGNIDSGFENLKCRYRNIPNLSKFDKLNTEALIIEIENSIKERRSNCHHHLSMFWNDIRIPAYRRLLLSITELEKGNENNNQNYFFRGYFMGNDSIHYYSAYIPSHIKNNAKIPLIILTTYNDPTNTSWILNWTNLLKESIHNIQYLADKYQFIPLWTNLGSGNDTIMTSKAFDYIVENALKYMPVDTNKIFLMGNCNSSDLTLNLIQQRPEMIAGIGFVNPLMKNPMLEDKSFLKSKKIYILCSYFDEEIPIQSIRNLFEVFRAINLDTQMEISYTATHFNAPPNYIENMLKYLLDDEQ